MSGSTLSAVEGAVSLVVLVFVLAVVLEVLASVPGVDVVEENPLGFVLDWMGEATDDDSNENNDNSGALW